MHVIHPTIDTGTSLYHHALVFCQRIGVTSLTLEQSIQVIQKGLDESLNRRLRWANNYESVFPYLNECLSWWDVNLLTVTGEEGSQELFCQDFYSEVLDPHLMRVENFLDQYVGHTTWMVWYMRDIGGDVVLEQGTDYRVLDWERRMGSGEWR